MNNKKWDVFIAHASEDKETFVRPLAVSLRQLGLEVWYDEFTLRPGDSLSRSIDRGLAGSRFGLVVISPHFIGKPWPKHELGGLVSREISEDMLIVPIWHNASQKEVAVFSPTLADKLAIRTANQTAQDIAIQVLRVVRPDLYKSHPRSELERLASGQALKDLQAELQEAKAELSEFRCPFCGAPLDARISAPGDPEGDYEGVRETFACGYRAFDGYVEQPCPSDPKFPLLEDYELRFYHNPSQGGYAWLCYPLPKTDMARKLSLHATPGRTKEEAEEHVRAAYARRATKWRT